MASTPNLRQLDWNRLMFFEEGGRHLESRVDSSVVVVVNLKMKAFNELRKRLKPRCVTKVFFEFTVERFLIAVLPGWWFRAKWSQDVVRLEKVEIRIRTVPASMIGVQVVRSRMALESIPKGFENKFFVVLWWKRKPYNLTAEDVNNRGEVPPSSVKPEIGEVRCPQYVPFERTQNLCPIGDIEGVFARITGSTGSSYSSPIGLDAKLFHHSQNALPVASQMNGQPPVSIRRMLWKCSNDLLFQALITDLQLWLIVERRREWWINRLEISSVCERLGSEFLV